MEGATKKNFNIEDLKLDESLKEIVEINEIVSRTLEILESCKENKRVPNECFPAFPRDYSSNPVFQYKSY